MTGVWVAVALIGALTVAFKALGPVVLGSRRLPTRLTGVVELLAPALFAALVVTQTFAADRRLVLDERAVGLAAAVVSLWLRAPLLVVVVAAAAATGLMRLFG